MHRDRPSFFCLFVFSASMLALYELHPMQCTAVLLLAGESLRRGSSTPGAAAVPHPTATWECVSLVCTARNCTINVALYCTDDIAGLSLHIRHAADL